jgi:MATE family multidrug resistance protein
VMWVNLGATAVNIVGDYALIFGHWGFPQWGIAGAAWATVASAVFNAAAYLVLLRIHPDTRSFHPLKSLRFVRALFDRLIHFGFPTGLQFFIDMVGFTVFLLLVGRLGMEALAASNVAFNINTLAFMPMIGIGIGVSILVGQALGRDDPAAARRSTWSGFHITFGYMAAIALGYALMPALFILPYARNAEPESFRAIGETAKVLLRFVAAYSLFDTMNIIFASALKGAGDTRFITKVIAALSWGVLIIPVGLAVGVFGAGLYVAWGIATLYVCLLGLAFLWRFVHGAWETMRVIEPAVGGEGGSQ